jgi:predicted nucleic acid-binding Zn ribbon protein
MRRRRTPRPLTSALSTVVAESEPATLLAAVQSAWAGAVGEAIAREATPVAERGGVVTVACRSATWAQELEFLSGQILPRIREDLPSGTVLEGLRFTASADPV